VKPAPFRYIAAETVDEAVAALGEHGDEAKILAGGQSLVPLMNLRLAAPAVLVDVNRVEGLAGIAVNGSLEIGAVTRQAAVERSAEARAAAPLVAEALRHVAHPPIRSRGTIGGTVAHADPAAEIPAVLLALGGEVVARSPRGERTIPADDLFQGYFTTALEADELLTAVRFPAQRPGTRTAIQEVARKQADFALAGVAVASTVGDDGICESARIVLFGVADRPVRAADAEAAVASRRLADESVVVEAARAATESIDPRGDAHASADYRRDVAGVLVRRALTIAAGGEAGGGGQR
jgi:carbon-monoxide dehydrogenase medium subunit